MKRILYAVLCCAVCAVGCSDSDSDDGDGAASNGAVSNGTVSNGAASNGTSSNGAVSNGSSMRYGDPLPVPATSDWAMFRYDIERSGHAVESVVGSTVQEVWRIEPFNTTDYGAAKGSASVVGGVVYCGTDTGLVVAASADDGSILWEYQIEETTHGIHGSPAIIGDMVYIGAYNGTMYALTRDSGELVWSTNQGFQIGSSPAVVPEWGAVFSANEDDKMPWGAIVSYDARSGDKRWVYPINAHAHSSVAIDVAREVLFVGDNAAILHALDTLTGELRWSYQIDQTDGEADIKSTPTVISDKGLVVFGAWSKKIHALNEDTGDVVWEYATSSSIMSSTAYDKQNGVLYVGSFDRHVHAVNSADGTLVWKTNVGAGVLSSPAISGDGSVVVVGDTSRNLHALSTETGDIIWSHDLGAAVTGSPTLVGNRIYVTSSLGALVALETSTP